MKKSIPLILATLFVALSSVAQVKKQEPKIYTSSTQKILTGSLANATEEIVKHKVTIKVLLNRFEFVYPNKERKDITVEMTQKEWLAGVKHKDYVITSHPQVKEIYFMEDENKIWLDFKNGETVIYTLNPLQ